MNIFNRFNRFFYEKELGIGMSGNPNKMLPCSRYLKKSIKEDTVWDNGLSKSWDIRTQYSYLKDLDGCFSRRHFSSPDGTISEIDCASCLSKYMSYR
jgi:hypothetical protein